MNEKSLDEQVYTFYSNKTPEEIKETLLQKLNNSPYFRKMVFEELGGDDFSISFQKRGKCKYRFIARFSEENGKTVIRGAIKYAPDNVNKISKDSFGQKLAMLFCALVIGAIVIVPFVIVYLVIMIKKLFSKKYSSSKPKMLTDFMCNYLGCSLTNS